MTERSFVGQRIDGHTLGKELGRGKFAAAYALEDNRAMKLSHHFAEERYRDAFIQEGVLLGSLNSPHILGYYGSGNVHLEGEGQERLYHITARARLGSVGQFIERRGGELLVSQGVAIITQAAHGLADLHRGTDGSPLVHQDIKLDNIFVDAESPLDKKLTAVIADLGLVDKPHESPDYVVGALSHFSPEKLRGIIDTESDTYALAVAAYRMLSGQRPYGIISSAADLITVYKAREIPQYSEDVESSQFQDSSMNNVRKHLLEYIVDSGMAFEPENRPTAENFGQTILDVYEIAKAENAKQTSYHESIPVPHKSNDVSESTSLDPVAVEPIALADRRRKVIFRGKLALAAAAAGVVFIAGSQVLELIDDGGTKTEVAPHPSTPEIGVQEHTPEPRDAEKIPSPSDIPSVYPTETSGISPDQAIVFVQNKPKGETTPDISITVSPRPKPKATESAAPKPTDNTPEPTAPTESATPTKPGVPEETPSAPVTPVPEPTESASESPVVPQPSSTAQPSASSEQSRGAVMLAGAQ